MLLLQLENMSLNIGGVSLTLFLFLVLYVCFLRVMTGSEFLIRIVYVRMYSEMYVTILLLIDRGLQCSVKSFFSIFLSVFFCMVRISSINIWAADLHVMMQCNI